MFNERVVHHANNISAATMHAELPCTHKRSHGMLAERIKTQVEATRGVSPSQMLMGRSYLDSSTAFLAPVVKSLVKNAFTPLVLMISIPFSTLVPSSRITNGLIASLPPTALTPATTASAMCH